MRSLLKRTAEALLARAGPAAVARALRPDAALVLAYHGIRLSDEPPAGDRSLHLPLASFERQLDSLARSFDIVPLESILAPPARARPRPRPRAAITFDDAYRGAVTAGVEALARRGLPATIFVAPAFLGGGTFWWDVLAAPDRGLDESVRAHALDALRGRDVAIREWARRRDLALHEPARSMVAASEAELRAAASRPGISLGSHTWSHPNLAALPQDELAAELERPLSWLRERFPAATVPWLAYPYGLSSPAVARAAADAGYRGALAVRGGFVPRDGVDPFAVPRLNVPAGLSDDGFMLRTAGLVA